MEPRKKLAEALRLQPAILSGMQTLKALACASLASLFPLFAEPMPREDVVEIPAKAGPEKEKGIAPPQRAPRSSPAS